MCVCGYTCINAFLDLCVCFYVWCLVEIYLLYLSLYVVLYVYMYVCMYVCMYVHVFEDNKVSFHKYGIFFFYKTA